MKALPEEKPPRMPHDRQRARRSPALLGLGAIAVLGLCASGYVWKIDNSPKLEANQGQTAPATGRNRACPVSATVQRHRPDGLERRQRPLAPLESQRRSHHCDRVLGLVGLEDQSRADFTNFHLRLETRQVEGDDAAVNFRWTLTGSQVRTYLICIAGTHESEHRTGDLGRITKGTARHYFSPARPTTRVKPGEWFTQEVIADGDTFTVIVQGEEVLRVTDSDRSISSGAIALWCPANALAAFRRIELRKLAPSLGSRGPVGEGNGTRAPL